MCNWQQEFTGFLSAHLNGEKWDSQTEGSPKKTRSQDQSEEFMGPERGLGVRGKEG